MDNKDVPKANVILHGFQILIHLNTDENNDDNLILSRCDLTECDVSNVYLNMKINNNILKKLLNVNTVFSNNEKY